MHLIPALSGAVKTPVTSLRCELTRFPSPSVCEIMSLSQGNLPALAAGRRGLTQTRSYVFVAGCLIPRDTAYHTDNPRACQPLTVEFSSRPPCGSAHGGRDLGHSRDGCGESAVGEQSAWGPGVGLRRAAAQSDVLGAVARNVVLAVALVFVIGLAVLTLVTVGEHGFSLGGLVSVFVVAVLGVGIFGALLGPRK